MEEMLGSGAMFEDQSVTKLEAERHINKRVTQSNNHYLKSVLNETKIKQTVNFLKQEKVSNLIGTLAHFCYWAVYGGFNELPMDRYHMEQMFSCALN